MATPTTTKTAADKAQAEAAAKAALAKKRAEAEELAKLEEYRRDVPPGIKCTEPPAPIILAPVPVHLYRAIHRAQAAIDPVRKNGENPHFRSKYATLDEIWETVKPAVNAAGIVAFSRIVQDGERWKIETTIAEIGSGETLTSCFPLKAEATTPQATGSAMTYARRYAICALLGIVTRDGLDDDGEAATAPTSTGGKAASAAADALGF